MWRSSSHFWVSTFFLFLKPLVPQYVCAITKFISEFFFSFFPFLIYFFFLVRNSKDQPKLKTSFHTWPFALKKCSTQHVVSTCLAYAPRSKQASKPQVSKQASKQANRGKFKTLPSPYRWTLSKTAFNTYLTEIWKRFNQIKFIDKWSIENKKYQKLRKKRINFCQAKVILFFILLYFINRNKLPALWPIN